MMNLTAQEIVQRIDHTLLKPETTPDQIDQLCNEVFEYGFGAVCVNPVFIQRARRRLDSGKTLHGRTYAPALVGVVSFPLGATTTAAKVDEARRAVGDGATEIDMVVALGALLAGDRSAVTKDIEAVAGVLHKSVQDGQLKVILETAALTTEQIMLGCRCCVDGGADFVKTSTGFHPAGGATVEHVRLLKRYAAPLRVKAAGELRTAKTALAMLEAGAARLGTSSGVAILNELNRSTA